MTENATVNVMPGQVPAVPADYAAMGVKSGYAAKKAEDLKFYIKGPSGEGKSTFLASIPDTLILDVEETIENIPNKRANYLVITSYEQLDAIIKKLVADGLAGKRQWRRVGIDTTDEVGALIARQIAKEKGIEDIGDYKSEGAGYGLIYTRLMMMIRQLEDAGYTWAITGHITERDIINPATKQKTTALRAASYPTLVRQLLNRADFDVTIYSIVSEEAEVKKVNVPGVGVIDQPGPAKRVERYYLDCASIAGQQGKKRGVSGENMKTKFELPAVGGWDVFVNEYNIAIKKGAGKV
jgi:hypothetical protein